MSERQVAKHTGRAVGRGAELVKLSHCSDDHKKQQVYNHITTLTQHPQMEDLVPDSGPQILWGGKQTKSWLLVDRKRGHDTHYSYSQSSGHDQVPKDIRMWDSYVFILYRTKHHAALHTHS